MSKKDALFNYCLRLGDNSLILSQRLSEWCGHAPILEEDLALTNIALDLIGQAREFLTYAGDIEGKGRTEDTLAYHRDAKDFRNLLLVEQPNGNFAHTTVRQFFFSAYAFHLYSALKASKDENIGAFAAKSLKEVTYHLRHSSEWMLRLGDGTEESRKHILTAIDDLWMYTGELFENSELDEALINEGIAVDASVLHELWNETVQGIFHRINLPLPQEGYMLKGGIKGVHTEHLGHLLAEMQFLPRAYPDAKW